MLPTRRIWSAIRLAASLSVFVAAVPPWAAAADAADGQSARVAGIVSRIRRDPVESRGLAAVGYSKRLRVLEIEFRRGGTYRYLDVPPAVYRNLLASESKAGFYNRNVRGKYKSVYVRPRKR